MIVLDIQNENYLLVFISVVSEEADSSHRYSYKSQETVYGRYLIPNSLFVSHSVPVFTEPFCVHSQSALCKAPRSTRKQCSRPWSWCAVQDLIALCFGGSVSVLQESRDGFAVQKSLQDTCRMLHTLIM
jgi:hypothetical protein